MVKPVEIVQVAVPVPLRRSFDYLLPASNAGPQPGVRVRVPFGRRELIGVVLQMAENSDVPPERLKPITEVLDTEPVLPTKLLKLLNWAAGYYHHGIGEVIETALPLKLRQGAPVGTALTDFWLLTGAGRHVTPALLARAPAQKRLWAMLKDAPEGLDAQSLSAVGSYWRTAVRSLMQKGWVRQEARERLEVVKIQATPGPELNPDQQRAVKEVSHSLGSFSRFLLYGVTGSGKTEVYLQVIEKVIQQGKQVLVLVPEIALTPQLTQRFQRRLAVPLAVLHSGLNDQARLNNWLSAKKGKAPVVLGTRSAVFTPFANLGLIVIDEEHDRSYKQQDGFRYHARDVAVMRAQIENLPIVLGSATPSLESLHNVAQGHYQVIKLPDRTGSAGFPHVQLLDMRKTPSTEGLSPALVEALQDRIARGEQSLIFLNRRGFSPVLMCYQCGWVAPCQRCDAKMVLHKASGKLRCHHCSAERDRYTHCPQCNSDELHPLGEGTERVEAALQRFLPHAVIARIDRDSTRRKGTMEAILRQVQQQKVDILIGTQMVSKGHDFPNVTLVGILNADQGLYSVDFRSPEQLLQQAIQVSGRCGRGEKTGQVLVQTFHPDHLLFSALQRQQYEDYADQALAERRLAGYPPYTFLTLLRAESAKREAAMNFVVSAELAARSCLNGADVRIMDPLPAPMERRSGRYRAQLLVQAKQRKPLHEFLYRWIPRLEASKEAKRVRWSLDVDPADLY